MKIVSEKQFGDVIIEADTMLLGEVEGNVTVLAGAKLDLLARVKGDLNLKKHSQASIRGPIEGNLYNEGANVELLAAIMGEVIRK
ncbi:MAG: hypothetical protein LPK26_21660 [Bacillaceae bacterium]|nr:hypothetical protein [Bacillaceae bacterium]